MKRLLIIVGVIVLSIVAGIMIAQAEGTCPDGDGWVKVESSEFVPVEGAVEYCYKAGSESSQGCDGGIFDTWPLPEGACGLSHWSYKLGEPTNTPTDAVPTPTLESTPTATVAEPTVTPEEPTPTRTPCVPLHCGSG